MARDRARRARLTLDLDLTPADVVQGVPRSMDCGASISIDDEECGTVRARWCS
ncbi:hypothetical protein [Streptomyces sp. KL116D]|uniref:hypothetical protein n=1 Tax=Streptomyces sp. KL116D TaxID=3045152 RepID=UPI0035587B3E